MRRLCAIENLEYKVTLPVTIDDVMFTFNVQGVIEIRGLRVYVPIDQRDLWESPVIANIGMWLKSSIY